MNYKKLSVFALSSLLLTGCASTAAITNSSTTWSDGACSDAKPGVTLAVDYLGKVTTHCALNFQGNGWSLFKAAGFEVRGTAKYPTAFACQINGEPETAKCDDSEISGAYWGYYVTTKNVWGYATTGAADHKSICGTWEGWVYTEDESTQSHLPTPAEFVCK